MSTNQIDDPKSGPSCKCGGKTWEWLDENGHYYQCEECGADTLPDEQTELALLRRVEAAARDFLRTRDSQLEEGLDDAEAVKRMFNTRRCLEALRNALEGEK